MKKKGQIFLIAASVFIVVLLIIKVGFDASDIDRKIANIEYDYTQQYFYNINREIFKSVEICYNQPENVTSNVFDFLNFTRKTMEGKNYNFNLFLVISSSLNNELNVTVINFLGENVDVNLTLIPSFQSKSSLVNDYGLYKTTFDISGNDNYKMIVKYADKESNVTISKDKGVTYTVFSDIAISNDQIQYKDKSQNSYNFS